MEKHTLRLVVFVLTLALLLAGCDGLFNTSSGDDTRSPSERAGLSPADSGAAAAPAVQETIDDSLAGSYVVQSVAGGSIRDYFEKTAAEAGSDAKSLLAELGVEDIDSLTEALGLTLNSDGSAVFGYLGRDGLQTKQGLWRQKGSGAVLTVFDAEEDGASGGEVKYRDAVLDCSFENGVLRVRKGQRGVSWVYCKADRANAAETNDADAVDINPASAEGVYQIKLINGKDAKSYYLEKYPDSGALEAQMTMMGISSVDALQEQTRFTLHADGTVSFANTPGNYAPQTGSWSQDGDRLTLSLTNPSVLLEYGLMAFGGSPVQYGNGTVQYTIRNGTLAYASADGEQYLFSRVGDSESVE